MSTRNRTTPSLAADGTTTRTGDLFPGTTPAELVEPIHGQPMTTSRRVAQMFSKRHDNVLRAINRLLPDLPGEFAHLNFEASEYTDETGRALPEYLLTQDGFLMLAMGFNGREAVYWRATFIKAFNNMAKALQRQQRALMSADRQRVRAEVARQHTAVIAVLVDTRQEQGKSTEAHHIANEGRLIGYAMTGEFMGVDRETLDADQLRLLHRVETLDIKLLVRGVEWHARKDQLRALVLDAQAAAQVAAQALESGDTSPRIEGST